MNLLAGKRVLVTGGSGFLGTPTIARFESYDVADVIAPRSEEYDLREHEAIRAVLADTAPDVVVHLAAVVGGIGANHGHAWAVLLRQRDHGHPADRGGRLAGVSRFVCVGTVCAYPKHAPVPFTEDDLWNGYPEETNAPYGLAKKMLLVQLQAYRQQYGFEAIYLLPVNLYGPRDNFDARTSHVIPALIKKCVDARESDATDDRRAGARARRLASSSTWTTPRRHRAAAARYEAAEPVNLGSGQEITIAELTELIAQLVGLPGRNRVGRDEAGRSTAPVARYLAGRTRVRLSCGDRAARGPDSHDRLVRLDPRDRSRGQSRAQLILLSALKLG